VIKYRQILNGENEIIFWRETVQRSEATLMKASLSCSGIDHIELRQNFQRTSANAEIIMLIFL
jgi:hypothetical protein